MNEQKIVSEMITFIEEKERSLQERKLLADQQAKNDTVKAGAGDGIQLHKRCKGDHA